MNVCLSGRARLVFDAEIASERVVSIRHCGEGLNINHEKCYETDENQNEKRE
jgi:hypothetical protein